MESFNQSNQEHPATRNWKIAAGSIAVLLLLTIGISAYLFQRQSAKQETESANWQTELDETRTSLTNELATLEGEYETQITENTTLKEDLTQRVAEIETLQKRVKSAQSQLAQSKANAEEIKGRLAQLEEIKGALEKDIAMLTGENQALTETNAILTETVASAQREIGILNERVTHLTDVNTSLNSRLAQIAPAGFTADNFTIVAQKKNDKLTAKASKADIINVAFDLTDVPDNYSRNHQIYVVLTDFDGTPVSRVAASAAQIRTADNVMSIQAADAQKINVRGKQNVKMTIDPVEDLDPGMYNLVVYADNGFLGATGFQLRKEQ
jgi:predicted nuclease with TOPRIM domain